ncbi:MAG: glycosyltransferase [Planctomycetes bacterium]|nr:glycosyltransferase [Planctomycetota bacterium]
MAFHGFSLSSLPSHSSLCRHPSPGGAPCADRTHGLNGFVSSGNRRIKMSAANPQDAPSAPGVPTGPAPALAIVIPFYNEGRPAIASLREIDRVLRAAAIPARYVLVDDGSRDDTWEALNAAAAALPPPG